ncbi:DUF2252 domain-containing protein [Rhodococcus sp. ARC_M6]|uniref:DUF2252 domain-containing protein n=1 Tax=Rhodococcus sp. ARC_M6 TaxID=2928852 RepID=UPI001FB51691|nr:DUF2252 domain-containing protein [Rhodococcus sp. ARC_M6]MCJ0902491.1 DUF2252 domain-containing protein [Rhodococcus sp. ARC_M6]
MTAVRTEHLTVDERKALGRQARRATPLATLADLADSDRDPISLLQTQAECRVPELVPIRYGRMSASRFSFFRGAALVMCDDLSRSAHSGIYTQLCGDAHLSNFGVFATPERKLAFDINDFDETYPGPFEWDVKRLAASLAIAGKDNGYSSKERKQITRGCAAEYRETMAKQAALGNLAVWYSHIEPEDGLEELSNQIKKRMLDRAMSTLDKARRRDSVQAASKFTEVVDGRRRFISDPPLIVPVEELFAGQDLTVAEEVLRERIGAYRGTLQWDRRVLLQSFEMVHIARKVVGVGSVGTRAWMILLNGVDVDDPLILQVKQALPSVLAGYVDGPTFRNEGERVVNGQRLMQASSDIFLGWERGPGPDEAEHDFYIRQLRDGKGSAIIDGMKPEGMEMYGRLCARVLAYAHARSGDRISINEYLGEGTEFDFAIAEFAAAYTKRNSRDHTALLTAIDDGRVSAEQGI